MNKALVAGALGVTGRTLVGHLESLGNWEVIGLSRRKPEFQTRAQFVSVDLLNRPEVEARLDWVGDVTHIFYAALQPGANFFEEVAPNLSMLTNLVETVQRSSKSFRKVVLIEGAKFYGAHLGPYKTPAKESDARHMPPNFYYNQEDYLNERSAGESWSWTSLAILHLRVRGWESHEHGNRHRSLRCTLQGNGIASSLPGVNRCISCSGIQASRLPPESGDVCRAENGRPSATNIGQLQDAVCKMKQRSTRE